MLRVFTARVNIYFNQFLPEYDRLLRRGAAAAGAGTARPAARPPKKVLQSADLFRSIR
jgi:hypothetical protein